MQYEWTKGFIMVVAGMAGILLTFILLIVNILVMASIRKKRRLQEAANETELISYQSGIVTATLTGKGDSKTDTEPVDKTEVIEVMGRTEIIDYIDKIEIIEHNEKTEIIQTEPITEIMNNIE